MIDNKTVTAIILVAGNSTRFGTGKNKNFERIGGKTVLSYSLDAFDKNKYVDNIFVAYREEDLENIKEITENYKFEKQINLVRGGETRKDSVYNCLKETSSDIVIIHDGARPAIKQEYIDKCIEAMDTYKGVTIAVLSKDTIKITDDNGLVINSTKRSNTWIIQTPQCFDKKLLLELHNDPKNNDVTDDCMILENAGYDVKILKGDYTNLKITTYEDLAIMKAIF